MKIMPSAKTGKWLHDFDKITTTYDTGRICYSIRDSILKGFSAQLEFIPLVSAEGLLVKVRIRRENHDHGKIGITWIWGGMTSCSDSYCPWEPGCTYKNIPGAEDCRLNHIRIDQDGFCLSHKDIPDVVVCGKAGWPGRYQACRVLPGKKDWLMTAHTAEILSKTEKTFEGFISIVWGKDDTIGSIVDRIINSADGEYQNALNYARKIANSIQVRTPDNNLNAGIRYVNYSADACWRPPSFLHSSSTWNDWYTGWRSLYGPTVCGWHDRVRSALRFQAQHANALNQYPQNNRLNRMENTYTDPRKKATGRIPMSVNPITGKPGGHHDCDQLFVDFAYHHLCWTGDSRLMKQLWPTLTRAVKFQKVTRDSDNDGLYVNILNNWMSDSHEYHQGGCTIQSAYLWKNNMAMAEIARLIGKSGKIYERESAKIKKAVQRTLWLKREGVFAEYKDAGNIIHPVPEAPSIYFPIEFGLADMFQGYRMLKYMEENFRMEKGLIYPSLWFPSICYTAPIVSETLNMALAAYHAGQNELGFKMLSACFKTYDTGILHNNVYVPFNPQAGCSDGCIDMLDTASLYQKTVVEGLFGIQPQVHKNRMMITPRFPSHWKRAAIETPDFGYHFCKEQNKIYLKLRASASLRKILRLPLRNELVSKVMVNGRRVDFACVPGIGQYYLTVHIQAGTEENTVRIQYCRRPVQFAQKSFKSRLNPSTDNRLIFLKAKAHNRVFFEPVEYGNQSSSVMVGKKGFLHEMPKLSGGLSDIGKLQDIFQIDRYCNGKLADFFESVPPEMHYGFRLHKGKKEMDVSYLMKRTRAGIFYSDCGIQFRLPRGRNNAVYIMSKRQKRLFSQGYLAVVGASKQFYARKYPNSVKIAVGREGLGKACLLFLGATSIMQSYVPAVSITFLYDRGDNTKFVLSNPDSFDFFLEHTSCHFVQPLTSNKEPWPPCTFSNHVRQQHADVAVMPVDPARKLEHIEISVSALDTTMALLGLTFLAENKNVQKGQL